MLYREIKLRMLECTQCNNLCGVYTGMYACFTFTLSSRHAIHVRRTGASWTPCMHDEQCWAWPEQWRNVTRYTRPEKRVIKMSNKMVMLNAAAIIIRHRRHSWRNDARKGKQWSQEWLMEWQSVKVTEEIMVTELAPDAGG